VSVYFEQLKQAVIAASIADEWALAVTEWDYYDVVEDFTASSTCVCGNEGLRYLFTIKNNRNNRYLFPIGSSCINRFERSDLSELVSIKEKLFKLLHAIENNEFLTLSTEFFSRKLLAHLYEIGAFKPTKWNGFNPHKDYIFMVDMFNKRTRSEAQEKKATAVILNSIRPFLREMLSGKIKRSV
jgi:hypothetical protein